MIGALFEIVAKPMEWVYGFTNNFILAISFMALIVILITAPLVLKQTKGMLEMQKLAPEMRRLQNEFRGDRQRLNEEMMKLYQSHKVNPLASCFPLLLQIPVFFIMFRILTGLTAKGPDGTFLPKYISQSSQMYQDLVGQTEMLSWGLDLSKTPIEQMREGFTTGWPYALLVIGLGLLYLVQQRMVAARATVSPTMSQTQQKIFQYLPVVFAIFLIFYLTGLVVYYTAQAIFRIGLQYYITHRFYKGDESLGQQAMAASAKAREMSQTDGGGGLFAQAKRDLAQTKQQPAAQQGSTTSKRVTPPKGKPTPSSRTTSRPASTGKAGRPGSNKKK